jgi:hypothetical protein
MARANHNRQNTQVPELNILFVYLHGNSKTIQLNKEDTGQIIPSFLGVSATQRQNDVFLEISEALNRFFFK